MIRIPRFPSFVTLVAITIAPVLAGAAPSGLKAEGAWVRWLPNGLPAAGYLELVNDSDADLSLTGASSPDYMMVHLHESYVNNDGTSGMRMIAKVVVPAHGTVRLSPGGYHLMLMKARHAIEVGDTVAIVLKMDRAGELEVKAPVKPANYKP